MLEQGRTGASQCTDAFHEHMLNEEANLLSALQHGYLGSFQTGICFARSLCFFKGSESIGDCLCSCASNPPHQVLLACRAASFIKVILPKAFPSFLLLV